MSTPPIGRMAHVDAAGGIDRLGRDAARITPQRRRRRRPIAVHAPGNARVARNRRRVEAVELAVGDDVRVAAGQVRRELEPRRRCAEHLGVDQPYRSRRASADIVRRRSPSRRNRPLSRLRYCLRVSAGDVEAVTDLLQIEIGDVSLCRVLGAPPPTRNVPVVPCAIVASGERRRVHLHSRPRTPDPARSDV